jgi:hypothetical protein
MTEFIDIPKEKTFEEKGLDPFGQSPLKFAGIEVNRKSQSVNESSVTPNVIQSGDITQKLTLTEGWIQSSNFVTGVSGWRISADGTSEFN